MIGLVPLCDKFYHLAPSRSTRLCILFDECCLEPRSALSLLQKKKNLIWKYFIMNLLTTAVFLGAFLLFGLEPLIGRMLVPSFGGAVHVWLTCMMFFQAMLLAGYLYAHLLARRLAIWHLLVLLLPLINLPLNIAVEPGSGMPVLNLLWILLTHIALPFVALSTTAVVAQAWLADSPVGRNRNPYPLYAASNAGALIGLFGYVFLMEPLAGLRLQGLLWTGGYILYLFLMAGAWRRMHPANTPPIPAPVEADAIVAPSPAAPVLSDYACWLALSSLPSAFLLTMTNFISMEVGSFPLVWVLPLALYLATFVMTFRDGAVIPKFLTILWPEMLLLALLVYLNRLIAIPGSLIVLFLICFLAHGALYARRPAARYLTGFYLTIALGGWIGGAVVTLITPLLFSGLHEYPLILLMFALTFRRLHPGTFSRFWLKASRTARTGRAVILVLLIALLIALGREFFYYAEPFHHRNFYGIYRIVDVLPSEAAPGGFRQLCHGKTMHGSQLLAPEQRHEPTAYYYRGGGFGDAFAALAKPRRIAVIGLGAGVVAAYAEPNDELDYYEIDPDNEKIAHRWFTYLNDTKAKVRVITGDGRLNLNLRKGKNTERNYDIIIVDAFSGDGIPTHLLTREALAVYLERLREDGLILLHISNRYYDLRPVVKAVAGQLKLSGAINVKLDRSKVAFYEAPNQCVVLTRNPMRLQSLLSRGWIRLGTGDGLEDCTPWSDDYINILAPLATKYLTPSK
jgi:spermidine synthase